MEREQPARTDHPPHLREQRTGHTVGNMCMATLDMTASQPPSGKGSRRVMSATVNVAIEPNLALACSMAWPEISIAVTRWP
jgi:hypothetical protein